MCGGVGGAQRVRQRHNTIWHSSLPDGFDSMKLRAIVNLLSLISAALQRPFSCLFKSTLTNNNNLHMVALVVVVVDAVECIDFKSLSVPKCPAVQSAIQGF